jgi:hypothetical protein
MSISQEDEGAKATAKVETEPEHRGEMALTDSTTYFPGTLRCP